MKLSYVVVRSREVVGLRPVHEVVTAQILDQSFIELTLRRFLRLIVEGRLRYTFHCRHVRSEFIVVLPKIVLCFFV